MNLDLLNEVPVRIKATQFMELTEFALVNIRCSIKNSLRYWSD